MHLKRDELKKLLSHIPARHRLMVLVTFWHGLRVSETINLTPENFSASYITVQRLKGSLKTVQPLIPSKDADLSYIPELLSLVESKQKGERLFPISRIAFYKIMRTAGELAGFPIAKSHPHVLKHSIAMQTIKSAGIEDVKTWLGHKNLSSTGYYLKRTDEEAAQSVMGAMNV